MEKIITIVVTLCFIFIYSGCKAEKSITLPVKYARTAKENYRRALYYLKEKDYDRAEKLFNYIIKKFTTSPYYVALAELGLADCEFGKGNYLEAAIKYRVFIERHPSHPKVEYALFKRGKAFFKQIPEDWFILPPSVERDLTAVKDALNQLRRFVEAFPKSKYVKEAKEMIEICIQKLTSHELIIARFYMKRKNYRGVLLRCKRVYERFPDSISAGKALLLSGKVLLKLAISKDREKEKKELINMWNIEDKDLINKDPKGFFLTLAKDYFEKVIKKFPNTGLAKRSKQYIKQLKKLLKEKIE